MDAFAAPVRRRPLRLRAKDTGSAGRAHVVGREDTAAWRQVRVQLASMPPIRLHDLRPGAASLILAVNVDIKR